MKFIKNLWASLKALYGTKEDIHNLEDYHRVQQWTSSTRRTYFTAFIIAGILTAITFISTLGSIMGKGLPFIASLLSVLGVPALAAVGYCLMCMGGAAMWLNRKVVIKSLFRATLVGYKAGEQIQTTHVDVTHEYGNTYKVSAYTENQGCLVAIIAFSIQYTLWATFCIYIAPYLILKKYKASIAEMKKFQETQTVA